MKLAPGERNEGSVGGPEASGEVTKDTLRTTCFAPGSMQLYPGIEIKPLERSIDYVLRVT